MAGHAQQDGQRAPCSNTSALEFKGADEGISSLREYMNERNELARSRSSQAASETAERTSVSIVPRAVGSQCGHQTEAALALPRALRQGREGGARASVPTVDGSSTRAVGAVTAR